MSKPFRCLYLTLVLVMYGLSPAYSTTSNPKNTDNTHLSDCNGTSALVDRLDGLDLALSTSACDAHLQRKLRDYLGNGSHSTERMLGRANQYFPVFEYYLAKHGMPESLKYLAVAESMLVPGAVSSARAAGLWQLMPATAREMGLRVDRVVDERLDLYRSTEAAVLMLKDLYRQFGDWHLALAAYNCGPGRVRRAIRAAQGHTHYPKVKRFLPRESQQYVAAYVAAAYTLNYYDDYGLIPAEYLQEDKVAHLTVVNRTSFKDIANFSGADYQQLRRMNPAFVRAYVPSSKKGYRIRVPKAFKWPVQTYLWGRPNLIATEPAPELAHGLSLMVDMDRHLDRFYLGVRHEALAYFERPITYVARTEAYALELYKTYDAVALND